MSSLFATVVGTGNAAAAAFERALDGWLTGLAARLVFAAVLFGYYWNSALTKVGEGVGGFFQVADGAYFQIVPPVVEAAGYDASAVAFWPWGLIVTMGTYTEFALPVMIVLGLLTRVAALGMIVFIVVQSYVDIAFHAVDAETIGALFDRIPTAAILDQRALWVFLLLVLVIKGAGALSLDALISRTAGRQARGAPVAAE
ncbi:MAG: DoxX family membrane protein [Pseudomonadota bacterium]